MNPDMAIIVFLCAAGPAACLIAAAYWAWNRR